MTRHSTCFMFLALLFMIQAKLYAHPLAQGESPGSLPSSVLQASREKPPAVEVISSCGKFGSLIYPYVYGCFMSDSEYLLDYRTKAIVCVFASLFIVMQGMSCGCDVCTSTDSSCDVCHQTF